MTEMQMASSSSASAVHTCAPGGCVANILMMGMGHILRTLTHPVNCRIFKNRCMPRMNYRIDDVRALLALHRSLSFVRGAQQLHITQSAFSRRIAQLEVAVGGPLVERSTRRVAFSAQGLELVRAVGPLLAGLDEAMEEAARCARGASGRVVVACLTTVAYALLPRVLDAFRRQYPQVRLHLRDDTGLRVTAAVQQREAEFGISVLADTQAGLHAQHVADDPYVLAFRRGHPLQAQAQVAWSELAPWRPTALHLTSANRQQMDAALAAAGIALPWFDEVEHLSSMLGLLRNGSAIGVLPRLALAAGGAELETRALVRPAVVRRIGLIRREETEMGQPAQALWTLLAAALGTASPLVRR
ncbi:LysR family transcriptional regulator [Verminephrobacter aporrectodeae subsp. tuberculatae]|uniref:LysR family transcriptional regulator n=2 Tax=Verminephrobacter TaxID=364316 RepID=A0ABT3KVW0_9BURK|nr:LysR family transcriptional regulator [Verminephrobacter aporrectodeae subsp. tuberculatae]